MRLHQFAPPTFSFKGVVQEPDPGGDSSSEEDDEDDENKEEEKDQASNDGDPKASSSSSSSDSYVLDMSSGIPLSEYSSSS